jgi:S1-C subfamily serine protease
VEVVEGIGKGGFDPRLIYEREAPGVVTIIAIFGEGGLRSLLEDGDGGGGIGSGFVLNGKGEIATNAHVITSGEGTARRRARQVYVEFADGNRVEADILGDDPNADIALLRIDPSGLDLRPLPLGSSSDVRVGAPVAAIGSPFGEEQSLSVGVVSAVDRDIESLTNFRISGAIQTDAAINPGNSGGPLVNAEGQVIGVNQQIRTASGGGEGVGFAVPVDMVRRSLAQLREDGRAAYAYLGVASNRIYPQLAERFDLPVQRGAWVQQVTPGGPAARAGLRGGKGREAEFQAGTFCPGGDVVTKVGATVIEDSGDLADAIARYEPGRKVGLEIYRDGKRRTLDVALGDRPARVADQTDGCSR